MSSTGSLSAGKIGKRPRAALFGAAWPMASGFEGGLVFMLVPVMAHWLETTVLNAFVADLGIQGFFFVYAIAFTWAFDRVFGLPRSAAAACEA